MTSKKILIDARMYGLEHSGIGRYLIHLIEELQKYDEKNKYNILLRKNYFNRLKFVNNWDKVLADFGHYSAKEQIKLPKIITAVKPDLVHFPHFNIPLLWNGKFVVTIHDMTMHKQKSDATNLPIYLYLMKRAPYKLVFGKAVNNSTKIITPTNAIKKELQKNFNIKNDKIEVIYEGINEVYAKNSKGLRGSKKKKGDYFIYTGNLYPHKNIRRLIEALMYLNKKTNKDIKLLIAGSRDVFANRMESDIKKLGAKKYIEFLGYLPDEELSYLYRKSLGFVYPSISEGFGLQGLEVMASGGLLLASDISVFREVYKDNAVYFNPYDFTSITRAMLDVIQMDNAKRNKRILKAKRHVDKFSWEKMAKETLNVYKACMHEQT